MTLSADVALGQVLPSPIPALPSLPGPAEQRYICRLQDMVTPPPVTAGREDMGCPPYSRSYRVNV